MRGCKRWLVVFEEQKDFLDIVLKKKNAKNDGQKVYQHLVYKLFFDALSSAYPLFYKVVGRTKFELSVCEFMLFGAKSEQMWQVADEFRGFVKKSEVFKDIYFADELLWFEWSEVALMMKNYKIAEPSKFSYKKGYRLSESCVLKKLKYRVFEEGSFEIEGEFYLLGFYDFANFRVLYREVSPLLYLFLKKMDEKGVKKATGYISKLSGQSKKEVKSFFRATLRELKEQQVLTDKVDN